MISHGMPDSNPGQDRTSKAIALALLAFFVFSTVDACTKILVQYYNIHFILFLSNLIGVGGLFFYALTHKGWRGLIPRRSLKIHLYRAVLTVFSSLCIVTALKYIPLADYYGFVFATPLVTALLSVLFLRESVSTSCWLAIACGFVGVWIIAMPSYDDINIGIIAALLIPLFLSGNAITLRLLGHGEYLPLLPFFGMAAITICNMPLAWPHMIMPAPDHILLFLFYGAAITAAVITLAQAFTMARGASVIAPFQYSSLLWGTLFGYILFGDLPEPHVWGGISLIVIAGLYLIYKDRKPVTNKS